MKKLKSNCATVFRSGNWGQRLAFLVGGTLATGVSGPLDRHSQYWGYLSPVLIALVKVRPKTLLLLFSDKAWRSSKLGLSRISLLEMMFEWSLVTTLRLPEKFLFVALWWSQCRALLHYATTVTFIRLFVYWGISDPWWTTRRLLNSASIWLNGYWYLGKTY